MTKRELIQFMDELVELASEENKTRAILVKENFISDFEKSYEYEKEVQTEVSYLPLYYIAAMPDDVQEEIKQKVIAALTEHGECSMPTTKPSSANSGHSRQVPIAATLRLTSMMRIWRCLRPSKKRQRYFLTVISCQGRS